MPAVGQTFIPIMPEVHWHLDLTYYAQGNASTTWPARPIIF